MRALRLLLLPFAAIFNAITAIRNRLYDQGHKPVAEFELVTIGVGNLAVGGTGKTPMIEHLIRTFHREGFKAATLSRGYGRSTRGFRLAKVGDTASTIGDEPLQFFRKFGSSVPVGVGEDRALGIAYLVDEHPDVEVLLLDDVFQHRRVRPTFQLLLTSYGRPFYTDFVMPAGSLRESRTGASRADAIVVTKCPLEIEEDEMIAIESSIRKYSDSPVFFTSIRYGNPVRFGGKSDPIENVILVTGIATAEVLVDYVRKNFRLKKHFRFKDHHAYSAGEVQGIAEEAKEHNASVITTEKDFVKLDSREFASSFSGVNLAYIPIEIDFVKSGQDFDEMVISLLKKSKKVD